jgi:hypothetical protein
MPEKLRQMEGTPLNLRDFKLLEVMRMTGLSHLCQLFIGGSQIQHL